MGVYFSDFVDINPRANLEKGKEYPFVEMGEVDPVRRYVNGLQKRLFKGGGTKFRAGDTLFARITPCLENGKIAQFISNEQIGFGSTEFFIFRAVPNISDPGFVYYLSKSDLIRQPAEKSMTGASGRQRADLNYIVNVEVPVVSLTAQRKIAAILSAYDDLIEINLRRIKILEEMAQNLYREWFVNFRFPGHEEARFVDSPLGRIPERWEVVPFTEVADILSGGTPKTSVSDYWGGHIPFFAPKDTPSYFYVTEAEKTITELGLKKCNSQLYPPETVFITARGTVGNVVFTADEMAMNQSCYALRGKEGISQKYLYMLMLNQVDYLKKNTGGATFSTIIVDTFRRMQIIKPPIKIIREFEGLISPLFRQMINMINRNSNLHQTRDLLLPKLISGEVDVSELDINVSEEEAV